ncbi:hypothetical protein [Thermoanaerobacterium sp. RBIITD]|uniref:WD40/YVTN/BNR-like repeat-containing protein n=1 Tax=Thermoanaerobacterium sp. RBIITD TaxID=1550240 RepID=UPI000BB7CD33|nr:hypothetical protein [Thermoanaerobacterium sp. RBIITD]SNX52931.1 hypothetical protein SAMN05660242_0400 [Thermoanaerobacterium sp. RBIITD]
MFKKFFIVLLIISVLLTGCQFKSNNKENAAEAKTSNANTSIIKWKWSFKDGQKSLNNLQIFKSIDSGKSWSLVSLPLDTISKNVYDINFVENVMPFFFDSNDGWISWINNNSKALYMLRTSDSGKTWNIVSFSLSRYNVQSISKIQFVSPQVGWLLAVSDSAASQQIKYLFKTDNGGKSWDKANVTSNGSYSGLPNVGTSTDMIFYGADSGWISVSNPLSSDLILYKTSNSGKTWSKVVLPVPLKYASYCVLQASVPIFSNNKNGTIKVDYYKTNEGKNDEHAVVYVSNDGGNTWSVDTSS